jgi:hypothetical protein
MPKFVYRKRLLTGILVSCVAAALTFHIDSVVNFSSNQIFGAFQFFGRVLVVPGILASMVISRDIHSFSIWTAVVTNVVFWLAVCWSAGALWYKLPKRRGRFAGWQPVVYTPERPSLLEAGAITDLHDERTKRWHANPAIGGVPTENGWLAAVERQHRSNFDLWHIEDEARRPGATDAELADVKRRVDSTNQLRNDLTEELDRILLTWLEPQRLPSPTATLHSESPGLIIDRLSILALKIYHTREESSREDAPPGHAERNRDRLAILEEQRSDVAGCLNALWQETLAGSRRFKLYRQMKMYNDPALNPAIYGKFQTGQRA